MLLRIYIYRYRINHLKGAQPTEKEGACADLSHIECGGHLLHLGLHCTEAERSLQHRLFNAQQLTHLLEVWDRKCKRNPGRSD